jgi:hypothetical protein
MGTATRVTINQLEIIVEGIAAIKLKGNYNLKAPGDNTRIKQYLGW